MKYQLLTLGIGMLVLSACSNKLAPQSQAPVAASQAGTSSTTGLPTTPTGARGSATTAWNWTVGGQALLNIDSNSALQTYASYAPNNPTNAQVNLYFVSATGAGYIKVAYQDVNSAGTLVSHSEEFDTGNGTLKSGWVTVNGVSIFQSFTQDSYGGLIVVLDKTDDADLMSGSIWFKNFDFSQCGVVAAGEPGYCAPQAPVGCWTISLGPYNCQDFLQGGKVVLGSRLFPSSYTRLGTFSGMAKTDIFH